MEIVPAAEEVQSGKPFTFTWSEASRVGKKLMWHTGKAAWQFGTSFLVLVVPLIIQLHREEQLLEMEKEQMGVLAAGGTNPALSGTSPAAAPAQPAK